MSTASLHNGVKIIQMYVKHLPLRPGVYRMFNVVGDVLYVGKAKELKKRVASYTRPDTLPLRLQRMIAETQRMEFVETTSEAEALLLEADLIKKHEPRYNVLLKDDKSYAFIHLTQHPFPLLTKHRGARGKSGEYFGPFASTVALNETLTILHKVFLLRSCADTVFNGRTRPCLQYQIKRCSAPCVGKISAEDYSQLVHEAMAFLKGQTRKIQKELAEKMAAESHKQAYEKAAQLRDRIAALTHVQSRQTLTLQGARDVDVFAIAQRGKAFCVQLFIFRHGANYGAHASFPIHTEDATNADVLEATLAQFYTQAIPAPEILINLSLPNARLLEEAFSEKLGRKVNLHHPKRGELKELIALAQKNAEAALDRQAAESASERIIFQKLQDLLELQDPPTRLEIYDNSHIQGAHPIGTMVVAAPGGFIKNAYRKFNLDTINPGDDYAMMGDVLTRRFKKAIEQPDASTWPSVVILDGGKGQLSVARQVFEDLGITDVALMAVAKGPERNAGRETFFMNDGREIKLTPHDPLLHYIQRLRDEAHRFAIGSHRARRSKATFQSALDDLPGIGPVRKKALLDHFGSAKSVKAASLKDLGKIRGISGALAKKIYDILHPTG